MLKNKIFGVFAAILAITGIKSDVNKGQKGDNLQELQVVKVVAEQSALEFLKSKGIVDQNPSVGPGSICG